MELPTTSIVTIKTPNFDAMRKFFEDMEFLIEDSSNNQLCPLFGERGVEVSMADFTFNLEEDESMLPNAGFNITIFSLPLAKLLRLQERLGAEREEGFYGLYFTFTTPDGGKVVIQSEL